MTALHRPFDPEVIPTQPFYFPVTPTLPDGFQVRVGRLFYHGLDLLALIDQPIPVDGALVQPATPMYLRWLPALRQNYRQLYQWFYRAKALIGYPGELRVAFASKANPSEPVVRTLLTAGAAYECSSSFDVDIVRYAAGRGWLDNKRPILFNGFKIAPYARNIMRLRAEGFSNLLPIFDDLEELDLFARSGQTFEIGLRARTDYYASTGANRFGLSAEDMQVALARLGQSSNLRLTTFHAMQTVSAGRGLQYQAALVHSVRQYAGLKRQSETLHCFDFGGGLPGRSSDMNFEDWLIQTLGAIMRVCDEEGVPAPDLIIESGRYLVQDHAAKLFRVVKTRLAEDGIPYYMIDGSIMSSFPDAWALGEKFTVLPVSGWDGAFGPARLAGLTCDHDDVYPTRNMDDVPLILPTSADDLVVGFFDCGAYQETLGGRRGAKHCLLPEGPDLILDVCGDGEIIAQYAAPQSNQQVLSSLGYSV